MTRRRLALVSVLAVLTATVGTARAEDPLSYVVAHRGGAHANPENTARAFRAAHEALSSKGARAWIEMDLRLTADGVPVVMHDATLDRTTTCSGTVASKTLAQLSGCNAAKLWPGPSEPVPTLGSVLAEAKTAGWRIVPELKGIPGEPGFEASCAALAAATLSAVAAAAFPADRIALQSFWPPCLERVVESGTGIRTMMLTSSETATAVAQAVVPQAPGAPAGFYLWQNAVFSAARGHAFSAPDHTTPDLTAEVVAAAHALGREVVVWTVNTQAALGRALDAGVDGVMSDSLTLLAGL